MDLEVQGRQLTNVGTINVLLGKNGSGKSTLLRILEQNKQTLPNIGIAKYVTPERGGELTYEGQIETNIARDPEWANSVRRYNRLDNFRQVSVAEFRRLETLVLRRIEKDPALRRDLSFSFDKTLSSINELLDQVRVVRTDTTGFELRSKTNDETRAANTLSSGESELVSLAIEILSFSYAADTHTGRTSYLFLDEPDVHLHPDLQERLMRLLASAIENKDIVVVIATHSTSLLGALAENESARVGFISLGQVEITFSTIDKALKDVLPIFGAHPLSTVFNARPILLVEGDDDERIWQQAVRTSGGRVNVWPCSAGDIQSLNHYEEQVESISSAIYENPKAFSLRDRDGSEYEIQDKAIVVRMRLFCRAAENLLLSDDVLASLGLDWDAMKRGIEDWLTKYPGHSQYREMTNFKTSGYDRLQHDIKSLRNVFMMLAGSQKPWEVAVGQAIAGLKSNTPLTGEHSLTSYLGPKLVGALSLKPPRNVGGRLNRYMNPHPTQ